MEDLGHFTIKSIYQILNFRGIKANKFVVIWDSPIPPKIWIFMQLVLNNYILTKKNLGKKGWFGVLTCHFCAKNETTNNLFLKCPQAKKIWFLLGNSTLCFNDWSYCYNIFDFSCQLGSVKQICFLVIFSAVCWMIWK